MGKDVIDSEEAMETSVVSERFLHRILFLMLVLVPLALLVVVVVVVVAMGAGLEKETVLEKGGCEAEGEPRRRRKRRHGMRTKKNVYGMNKVGGENKRRCE
jgi:hypothetical protein